MKTYFAFTKARALPEPHHQIVLCHIQDTHCMGILPLFSEAISVITAPIDWAITESDGDASVLEGMCNMTSLPLLPGPLCPGVGVNDRILSIDQIELFNFLLVCKQMTDVRLNC